MFCIKKRFILIIYLNKDPLGSYNDMYSYFHFLLAWNRVVVEKFSDVSKKHISIQNNRNN